MIDYNGVTLYMYVYFSCMGGAQMNLEPCVVGLQWVTIVLFQYKCSYRSPGRQISRSADLQKSADLLKCRFVIVQV